MKLLSPAGDMQSLKMAVYNGADEVYLGLKDFNARNNIEGFTLTTLKSAVDFAHLYNVKVHLAINILFSDAELQSALDYIVDAFNMGVDAFIVQDLGLLALIHERYPMVELHASTQMGIHNLEGVQKLLQFGVKRIVLARETPISEIKRIRQNTDVELEYFAQGALCVCFSGNCYISSYLCNASGNRGKCKQLCRLPYTLTKAGKEISKGYLLSAKDFCMIDRLHSLEEAGITAIKIEGRARRPYYVASTTREYRNALDGKPYNIENLKLAFNRDYTAGYFDGNSGIISKYNNHIGLFAGTINKVNKGKKFNEFYFNSQLDISPKSTLKVFSKDKEKCTISAYDIKKVGNTYRVTTTHDISLNDNIYLLSDNKLDNDVTNNIVKRQIHINIITKQNQPICAEILLNNNKYPIFGDICQASINQPITNNDISSCFEKSEYFSPILSIDCDNVFISKSRLNDFRRNVYDKVYNLLTQCVAHIEKTKVNTTSTVSPLDDFEITDKNKIQSKCKNIIYSPSQYNLTDIQKFVSDCKNQNKVPYLNTPNFLLEKDIELLKNIVAKTGIGIVANNYSTIDICDDVIIGAGLNIYNHISANTLGKPYFTAESSIGKKIDMPYMTLRHCPIKEHLHCDCNNCKYSDDLIYILDNGKKMRLKRIKMSTCTFYLEK